MYFHFQAIKRNTGRFPIDSMFQLTQEEYPNLRSQFVTSSWGSPSIRFVLENKAHYDTLKLHFGYSLFVKARGLKVAHEQDHSGL